MAQIERGSLLSLEAYARERNAFRARVIEHKKRRRVHLGDHVTLIFEDELTVRYQIQEMLRIERIFEDAGIEDELEVYNPLVPDGGNLKAFSRMDGASIPTIEIAQKKAYTALFGVSTQDFFDFIKGDPSLLAGIPTLARVAAWGGGFPIKVNGEVVGAIGLSGAPTVQNDVDCARAALALVSDAVPTD